MATSPAPTEIVLEDQGIRGLKDVFFGSAVGIASKVFEHPFDLCKVRLQAQVLDEVHRFNGPVDCLTQTYRYEGVRGLYRGLTFPVIGAMFENAVLFLTYNQLQSLIKRVTGAQELGLRGKALAACGGGIACSFFLTPLELIKCKMQVQMMAAEAARLSKALPEQALRTPIDPRSLTGPVELIKQTFRFGGIRGFYLGHLGTLLREGGGATAWFTTKEFVVNRLVEHRVSSSQEENPDPRLWESALAGACAGVAYNIALFPADSVKSALQTEEEMSASRRPSGDVAGDRKPKSTFFGTFRSLYKARGIRGLYAGCGVTVARAIPSSAMIFVIYDALDQYFR